MKKILGLLKKVAIALVVLAVIGAVFGGGSGDKDAKKPAAKTDTEQTADAQPTEDEADAPDTQAVDDESQPPKDESAEAQAAEEEPEAEAPAVEYQDVSVDDLIAVLKNNPMNAKNTYEGTYIRLTGYLNNIDASGKYFSLDNGEEFTWDDVQCYIGDDATRDRIAAASMDDRLTVCGKVTSVGEILGYSMDVDYIE